MKSSPGRFRREAECQRLAHTLACEPAALDFLDALDGADLRQLRLASKECLARAQRPLLTRAIQASRLLPATLIASIGEHSLGPLLCAHFSDCMSLPHLLSICRHLSPRFMAEVGLHLEIDKICEMAQAMPPATIRGITREILVRGEYILLGEVLDRLPPSALRHVAREFTAGEPYLRTMFYVESAARRQEIVELLPEGVLLDSMRAVARAPEALLPQALSLTLEVSPAWQRRMMRYALDSGDSLLADTVAGIVRLELWGIALPLVQRFTPEEMARLMSLPAWRDPAVLETLLQGGARQFLRPWVEVMLAQLPEDLAAPARARLAAMDAAAAADEKAPAPDPTAPST